MSLRDRVFEAAGGARWSSLRHFTSHLMLDGSLVEPLKGPHSLKEIVAEGDIVSRSIRISGFSDAGGVWGFYPDFVTIQHDDGAFVGARREAAPRPFRTPKDEAELVYLCGLSIWSCMTAPLAMLGEDARAERAPPHDARARLRMPLRLNTHIAPAISDGNKSHARVNQRQLGALGGGCSGTAEALAPLA